MNRAVPRDSATPETILNACLEAVGVEGIHIPKIMITRLVHTGADGAMADLQAAHLSKHHLEALWAIWGLRGCGVRVVVCPPACQK